MSSPKDFHIDAIYPEPLSRLRRTQTQHGAGGKGDFSPAAYRRAVKKQVHRGSSSGRFRTQPITFQEIQEVDEENVPAEPTETETGCGSTGAIYNKSETDLKAKFELFYRSISNPNENKINNNNNSSNSRTQAIPCAGKQQQSSSSSPPPHPSSVAGLEMKPDGLETLLKTNNNNGNNINSTTGSTTTTTMTNLPSGVNTKSRPSI